ncbi:MAG: hypothetical protein RLZZ162_3531, partial [Verrucomicrobiota bacterium]
FRVGGGGGLGEDFGTRGVARWGEGTESGQVNVEVGERDVEGAAQRFPTEFAFRKDPRRVNGWGRRV